ncbi:glucosamine-6-phosphate deaminase [Candidatus Sumerlaeota bacterium]|nr:glucosamine-6-phosphate deaminase [Candidatus Sumerlaeota bacterium]
MGEAAADRAAEVIGEAVRGSGEAHIVLATGASQFEMLASLVRRDIRWERVTAFHLDEYIGLPVTHPASFRRYLQSRFIAMVPGLRMFHAIRGEAPDPQAECRRLGEIIRGARIDLACIGIGENGHIAFNDPPADFETKEPFLVVELDEACRRQQLGEGWFKSLDEVPTRAISMSVHQILKARSIVCTVPDERKAKALRGAVEGDVTPAVPASILQRHPSCHLFADEPAFSLLRRRP